MKRRQDAFDEWYEKEYNPNPTGGSRTSPDHRRCLFLAFDAGRRIAGRIPMNVGSRPGGKAQKALRMVQALMPAIKALRSTVQAICDGCDEIQGTKDHVSGKNDLSCAMRLLGETRYTLRLVAKKVGINLED